MRNIWLLEFSAPGGGGGLPYIMYITDGDARQNFQKQPLKVQVTNFIL